MNQRLEKNIYKIPDSITNSKVGDLKERVEQYIDHGLQYGHKLWHKHLVGAHRALAHRPKITCLTPVP